MKLLLLIIHILFSIFWVTKLEGQTFICDGQTLIATSDGEKTTLSRPLSIPFVPPFLSPFAVYNGSLDALGYNSKDNYIYAIQEKTNNIVRVKRDNTFESIGSVDIVDTLRSYAGDCTPEGLYLCHDYKLNQLLVFDVTDDFEMLDPIDLFWDPTSPNSGAFETVIFDFAVDPNNPSFAYAHQGNSSVELSGPQETNGYMLQINLDFNDPNLGMVTPIQAIDTAMVSHLGALVFSPQSALLGFGTSSDGFNPEQSQLFAISAFGGSASPVLMNSLSSKFSDGCSCPFSLRFVNLLPGEGMSCNNSKNSFRLEIEHNSYIPIENAILRDTLPEGMIIDDIVGIFDGNITEGTGIGHNILEITGLTIPAKTSLELEIKVLSIDAKVGPTYNQAFLYNLPERYNGRLPSDEIFTVSVLGDPTYFFVYAREIEELAWEITKPTDCLDANDGKIKFTSPQFFSGQKFEVGLRNKIGWDERIDTFIIDSNQSFEVDALIPGEYQVFSLRLISENCSLALKDTTITMEAPNDLLRLEIDNNGPICEGETLELYSITTPSSPIRWTGPLLFGSEDINPIFESATIDRSGHYIATAKLGYCIQIDTLEADVKPLVNISISSENQYCARDTIRLITTTQGEDIAFDWYFDTESILGDSTLIITNAQEENEGNYQVIADNGACSDTTDMDIIILPTPTLSLDEVFKTDFCGDVVLSPQVTGDTEVSYSWSPKEGLNCAECKNPVVEPIVQSNYKLKIENQFLCTDSAAIDVVLDKEVVAFASNIFNVSSSSVNNRFALLPGCVAYNIQELSIYDRWGSMVFHSESISPDNRISEWDGYEGRIQRTNGVYIWRAKIELVDGSIEYITGDITLIGR